MAKPTAPLNDEMALRIGLAAKALRVTPKELLSLLIHMMGEPITQAKLKTLRAKKVREHASQFFEIDSADDFEKAFALLKGRGINQYLKPRPEFPKGTFCEIKGSVRIACSSDSAEMIDGQFSRCMRYLIYQVSPDTIRLIDIREPSKQITAKQSNQARASLLKDCSLLYTTAIGAQASAKVVNMGLHPIKLGDSFPATEALQRLQKVLAKDNPPPWLAKAMGKPNLGVKLYGESIA